MAKSLYIHIPFCRKKCIYCDFCSVPYQKEIARQYIATLSRQVDNLEPGFSSVYIGGGTPTVLDIALWEKLLSALKRVLGGGCEFTVEANPESLDEARIDLFRKNKVNRLSIGIQSLSKEKLRRLGRIHSRDEAIDKVHLACRKGFKNISADMIFGVWQEKLDSWKRELKQLVKLPLNHISLYALTCEKGTSLFKQVKKKETTLLDEKTAADMYKYSINFLPRNAFPQYEVSNFAKGGLYCRHNFNYWENNSYLGLGVSAVSYARGIRARNVSDINRYITIAKEGKTPVVSKEELSPRRRAKETAALKIRTRAGIDFSWFREKTGFDFLPLEGKALRKLARDGFVECAFRSGIPEKVNLTKKGFLFCDTVSSAFL